MSPKCKSIPRFDKIILLIRNPFDAIWSEYQRRVTGGVHNGKVFRDRGGNYLKAWRRISKYLAVEYVDMWENNYYPFMNQSNVETLIVRYEDLKDNSMRERELERIVSFISLPSNIINASNKRDFTQTNTKIHIFNNNEQDNLIRNRIKCSFVLSDTKLVHRVSSSSSSSSSNSHIDRGFLSKSDVFTRSVVCELWTQHLQRYAEPMGYGTFNNFSCDK